MSNPNTIFYETGYKYCHRKLDYYHLIDWYRGPHIDTEFITLIPGLLIIRKNYSWDGPSGPTFDTRNFMRGSLVHDALYQLMREGWLSAKEWRLHADQELRRICIEDGMSRLRAQWVYLGVRWFAEYATRGNGGHELRSAP